LRWTTAHSASATSSIIVVFSRGPPVAYVTKPWNASRLAAAATPATLESKASRVSR
jgi:hypothetical protein